MFKLIEDTVVIERPTLLTAHNSAESLRNEESKAAYAAKVEAQLRENPEYVACQLYVAAFMSIKTPENEYLIPTSNDVFAVYDASNLLLVNERQQQKIAFAQEVCAQAHVFHWPLMFPEILGDNGSGFDCVLGNPPWEKPKVEDVKWFASHQVPEIANAQNADKRKKLIKALATGSEPEQLLYAEYQRDLQLAQCLSNFIHLKDKDQGRFTLTGIDDCNLFALVAEMSLQLRQQEAESKLVEEEKATTEQAVSATGLVVPVGIIADKGTKDFCQAIFSQHKVAAVYHFTNTDGLFPTVDERYYFVSLTLRQTAQTDCAFYLKQVAELDDQRRHVALTYDDFVRFNPNTKTAVLVRTDADLLLCRKIYQRAPVLVDESLGDEGNPWQLRFMRMFDMSNDSNLFETDPMAHPEVQYLPLYEGKLFWQFDHRFNTYAPAQQGKKPKVVEVQLSDKRNSAYAITPQYWVPAHLVMDKLNNAMWGGQVYKLDYTSDGGVVADDGAGTEGGQAYTGIKTEGGIADTSQGNELEVQVNKRGWMLAFRRVSHPTNRRSFVFTVLPTKVAANDKAQLLFPACDDHLGACLLAIFNSLVLEFVGHLKQASTNLGLYILKQLPVLPPEAFTPQDVDFICEPSKSHKSACVSNRSLMLTSRACMASRVTSSGISSIRRISWATISRLRPLRCSRKTRRSATVTI